jgi:Trk-type K+ transport system membrane component
VIRRAVFIVTSAFATSGLSVGVVPNLSTPAQVIVIILMFVGQVGTIAAGSSRALKAGQRLYRYPAEQTLVG